MSAPRLRAATIEDADALAALWDATGIGYRREHLHEELTGVLARNPELLLVVETSGVVVAGVLGTFD